MKVKRIYKYATGDKVPKGAIYLSSQTETVTYKDDINKDAKGEFKKNILVWHYFLVEVEEDRYT